MLVRFTDNLGTNDANGLDVTKCRKGMECEVPDADGEHLVARGVAEEVVIPSEVRGVAAKASIADAPAPEIVAVEKKPQSQATGKRPNPSQHKE